jgi:GDP-4-dehydro-6-deoxy-D-mannose reductase
MKYLVTGFSGFVSQHFLHYLRQGQRPCELVGIDLCEPAVQVEQVGRVKCSFHKLDLLEMDHVKTLLGDLRPDFILHLASFSSVAFSWDYPNRSFVNNTNIFLNLLEALRELRFPCRLLSVGSSEEYGGFEKEHLPLTEEQPPNPLSPYAVARASQEMLSRVYARSYGLDIVMTRSFNHVGPGQKEVFAIPSFARQLVSAKAEKRTFISVGNVDLVRDFLDVRDVVEAYDQLLHKGRSGEVYNVCSGTGVTLRQVIQLMASALGLNVELRRDPARFRANDIEAVIGSNKKLRSEVGWRQRIPLEQSLRDVLASLG